MAATYDVVAAESTIQVLSPTTVIDVMAITIQCKPSGIIARFMEATLLYQTDAGVDFATGLAESVAGIMGTGKVLGGTPGQTLDASGLLADVVDFTVGYTPPGSVYGPLTTQVEVDTAGLILGPLGGANVEYEQAIAQIDAAYNLLAKTASG